MRVCQLTLLVLPFPGSRLDTGHSELQMWPLLPGLADVRLMDQVTSRFQEGVNPTITNKADKWVSLRQTRNVQSHRVMTESECPYQRGLKAGLRQNLSFVWQLLAEKGS